jgi:PAS domain S-box-containing protein
MERAAMDDEKKSKQELMDELDVLRRKVEDTTERKQKEEILRDREEELAAIYENAPLIMLLVDKEWRIKKANVFSSQLTGRSVGDMVDLRCGEALCCIHALDTKEGCGFGPACKDCKLRLTAIDTIETGHSHHGVEASVLLSDGGKERNAVVLISTTKLVIKGQPTALLSMEDISERKRAEEALRLSEEKFRTIFENSSSAMAIIERDTTISMVNREYCKMGLYEEKDIIGKSWTTQIHPEDLERLKEYNRKRLIDSKNAPDSYEFRFYRKDGEIRHALMSVAIIPTSQNIVCSFVDITERKQLEELLRISLTKYKTLFETLPLGITVSDKAGNIIESNREAEWLLSLQQEEHVKRTIDGQEWRIIRSDGSPMPADEYASVRALKENRLIRNVEMGIVKGDGNVTWINVTAAPIPQKDYGVVIAYSDITQRKWAEEALRKRDIQLKKLTSLVPGMLYQFTKRPDGTYCVPFTTEAIKDIFGCSPQDVREDFSPIARIILPDDFDKVVDSIEYSAKHLTIWTCEYRVQNPGQSIRWILGNSTPEKLADGSITWYGFNTDITKRKRVEESLRESEERYKRLVESSPDIVWSFSNKRGTLYVSARVQAVLGYSQEYLFKNPWLWNESIHPDDRDVVLQAIAYFAAGRDLDVEYRIKDASGEWLWFHDRSMGRWVEGSETIIEGISTHITERKIMEDALRKSEEQYRSLVESTKDSIYLLDRDLRYMFANNTYLERTGLTLQQLIGRSYRELHPFPNDSFPGYVNDVFETGESTEFEYKSFRDNKPFLRTLGPVRGEQGKTIAVTVISKDVTPLKKVENMLRKYQGQLRALMGRILDAREEERVVIAREIHDELGGALTGLKIDLSYLASTLPKMRDTAKRNSFVNKLKTMTNLIDETIHTVRRIITDLRPSILDDFGLIAAIEWQAQEFQKRTGIECEFISALEDLRLDEQHSTAIFRIFQESLTNVIRHAAATKVTVRLYKEADSFVLKVTDNGKGIIEEKITDPKSLGLLGMRERAMLLGGTVDFSGEPWKGTTVSVEIPLAE